MTTDRTRYLSNTAWRTILKNVQRTADRTYTADVYPEDDNDLNAGTVPNNGYLCDNIGNIYPITGISGLKITVYDALEYGDCPQNFKPAIVFQSPENAPYLMQGLYRWLDQSAKDNFAAQLAILWHTREVITFTSTNAPSITNYQTNYANRFGQEPDFTLITDTGSASVKWERQEKPVRNYVGGLLDSIVWDLSDNYSGHIIISR